MNLAVIQFPGSNCDQDCVHVVRNVCGHSARLIWHKDKELGEVQAVLVPGGFSYGDYLRTGCIARFSPVMQAVQQFAANGGLVLGICNGFQILCEAGLLPGALVRNRSLQFRCEHVYLKTASANSPFTNQIPVDRPMRIPVAHGDGCYFVDEGTLADLREREQVLWQYCDRDGQVTEASNPNGSIDNIAGVCNVQRNVAGLMPHPERASEAVLGCDDGLLIFKSLLEWLERRSPAVAAG
jgi:phosphoribosylformylglycinamidine synthase